MQITLVVLSSDVDLALQELVTSAATTPGPLPGGFSAGLPEVDLT